MSKHLRSAAGIKDPTVRTAVEDIYRELTLLIGQRGVNRALRVNDLTALGIIAVDGRGNLYDPTKTYANPMTASTCVVPDAPTNFAISGSMLSAVATWDAATYRCHSHTEVWASDTDDVTAGQLVATSSSTSVLVTIPAAYGTDAYFWARHVSVEKVAGPFNATAGTLWTSSSDLTGIIVMWSGAIGSIPAGWALCDGGGTPARPDLRDRFIVGAGSTYAVAATGGALTDVTTGPSATTTVDNDGAGSTVAVGSDTHTHTADILPPYYALAFIVYEG